MCDYKELEKRLNALEARVTKLEESCSVIETTISCYGNYKARTTEELKLMDEQLVLLIDTLEAMLNKTISDDEAKRATALKKRLKNNQTRVRKAAKNNER
ncbi:hypothetical protein NTH32_005107 [Vibrio harveyi]|nr:hypothetical protein [Vibrio harveyi]